MKPIASLVLSGWALLVPAAWAQTEKSEPDPFEVEETLIVEEESERRPTMIRVQVEYIEMAHEMMTELLSGEEVLSDNALRKRLRALVKKKDARVVETQLLVAQPGQKATVESNEEFIYPTEYEPAEIPNEINLVNGDKTEKLDVRDVATGPTPTAFETRNLGSTLEIQPDREGDLISLDFEPELVYHVKNEIWAEWKGAQGDAPIQMPVMYSMRMRGRLVLRDGNYRLAAALSPKGPDGHPDYDRKVMIFVRADLVEVE